MEESQESEHSPRIAIVQVDSEAEPNFTYDADAATDTAEFHKAILVRVSDQPLICYLPSDAPLYGNTSKGLDFETTIVTLAFVVLNGYRIQQPLKPHIYIYYISCICSSVQRTNKTHSHKGQIRDK